MLGLAGYSHPKKLVLVIDTVVSRDDKYDTLEIKVGNQGFFNSGDYVHALVDFMSFPNFVVQLDLEHDSSTVEIPIDKNSSHIILFNVYSIHRDTVTIDKLILYDSKGADSTFKAKYQYRWHNGQIEGKPYKVAYKKFGTKYVSPPARLYLSINGTSYQTSLVIEGSISGTMNGHGDKPRKPLTNKGTYKRNARRIHVTKNEYKYYWVGRINLMPE